MKINIKAKQNKLISYQFRVDYKKNQFDVNFIYKFDCFLQRRVAFRKNKHHQIVAQ